MEKYPYKANDGREDESASGNRVLGGGSFSLNGRPARCAFRHVNVIFGLNLYTYSLGIRVVASPA